MDDHNVKEIVRKQYRRAASMYAGDSLDSQRDRLASIGLKQRELSPCGSASAEWSPGRGRSTRPIRQRLRTLVSAGASLLIPLAPGSSAVLEVRHV